MCIKILKRQSKWDEIIQILENTPIHNDGDASDTPPSEFGVAMTRQQVKLETAEVMKQLHRYDDARIIYESILESSPDDWLCWTSHLECSKLGTKNDVGSTKALANKVIKEREESRHQLRGPHSSQTTLLYLCVFSFEEVG